MEAIDIFDNSPLILEKKRPLYIISYLTVILIVILAIILIASLYEYSPYKSYLGKIVISENDFYINILMEDRDVSFLNKNILINNKKYISKTVSISNTAYIGENTKKYHEVKIKSNIDDNLIIQNNIIQINIKLPKTTLLKELIKNIRKGLK